MRQRRRYLLGVPRSVYETVIWSEPTNYSHYSPTYTFAPLRTMRTRLIKPSKNRLALTTAHSYTRAVPTLWLESRRACTSSRATPGTSLPPFFASLFLFFWRNIIILQPHQRWTHNLRNLLKLRTSADQFLYVTIEKRIFTSNLRIRKRKKEKKSDNNNRAKVEWKFASKSTRDRDERESGEELRLGSTERGAGEDRRWCLLYEPGLLSGQKILPEPPAIGNKSVWNSCSGKNTPVPRSPRGPSRAVFTSLACTYLFLFLVSAAHRSIVCTVVLRITWSTQRYRHHLLP